MDGVSVPLRWTWTRTWTWTAAWACTWRAPWCGCAGQRWEGPRGRALQPAVAFEPGVQADHDQCDQGEERVVAVVPVELGHVVEVHPVDPRDHGRDRDDRDPGRDLAHVLVVRDGRPGEAGLQDRAQHLVERR